MPTTKTDLTIDLTEVKAAPESIPTGQNDEWGNPLMVNFTSMELASKMIATVKDGQIDPLQFAVMRKIMADAMDLAAKDPDVKAAMLEEVRKNPKQKASVYGATISVFSRPKYRYDENPTWRQFQSELEPIKARMREIETQIKDATKKGVSITDAETGEVIAEPVTSYPSESLAVSFKKK